MLGARRAGWPPWAIPAVQDATIPAAITPYMLKPARRAGWPPWAIPAVQDATPPVFRYQDPARPSTRLKWPTGRSGDCRKNRTVAIIPAEPNEPPDT
jgi:hypothetical protein